jgi:heme exporter protein B
MKSDAGAAGASTSATASRWLDCASAVFTKELRVELRTRYALSAVALFAVITVIMVSAVLVGASVRADVKAALVWIILLFAALSGLARVFVREEEAGTAAILRLTAPPSSVFAGKLLFNLALIGVVELVSVPLFLLLMPVEKLQLWLLLSILTAGGAGLASAATFTAALIAHAASGKSALYPIISFPVLMPLALIAVQATVGAFDAIPIHILRAWNDVGVLGAYAIVMTTASFLLFEYVWHE